MTVKRRGQRSNDISIRKVAQIIRNREAELCEDLTRYFRSGVEEIIDFRKKIVAIEELNLVLHRISDAHFQKRKRRSHTS